MWAVIKYAQGDHGDHKPSGLSDRSTAVVRQTNKILAVYKIFKIQQFNPKVLIEWIL